MADQISYTNKVQGQVNSNPANQVWSFGDANEVKTVVNAHATNIDELQPEYISGMIEEVSDKTYYLVINAPYACTVVNTTTRAASGTCTATFEIDGTPLGGTANSVSSAEESQSHASANAIAAGEDLTMVITSNSSCLDMRFTVKIERTLS